MAIIKALFIFLFISTESFTRSTTLETFGENDKTAEFTSLFENITQTFSQLNLEQLYTKKGQFDVYKAIELIPEKMSLHGLRILTTLPYPQEISCEFNNKLEIFFNYFNLVPTGSIRVLEHDIPFYANVSEVKISLHMNSTLNLTNEVTSGYEVNHEDFDIQLSQTAYFYEKNEEAETKEKLKSIIQKKLRQKLPQYFISLFAPVHEFCINFNTDFRKKASFRRNQDYHVTLPERFSTKITNAIVLGLFNFQSFIGNYNNGQLNSYRLTWTKINGNFDSKIDSNIGDILFEADTLLLNAERKQNSENFSRTLKAFNVTLINRSYKQTKEEVVINV